jgi:hypothetical protein
MKRLIFLAAFAAIPSAFADDDATSGRTFKVVIAPNSVHEECVTMKAGERRAYEWTSNHPLDFNVHYHHGKDISFPVKKDNVSADKGTFEAKSAEGYCWMWTVGKAVTTIEAKIAGQ